MLRIHFYRITFLAIAISITGCTTAVALRDANEQLTTYYYAKVEAQQAAQSEANDNFFLVESAMASLKTLAENAAAEAQKEKNPLNKISFYRIATTAAWQAEDGNVVTYANAGTEVCDEGHSSKAPRDCGMLVVIPMLASVDEQTKAFNVLQDKVTADDWVANEPDKTAAETIYDRFSIAFNKLMQQRPSLLQTGAHPDFIKGLDRNIGTLLCVHIDDSARGLLGLVGSSQLGTMDSDVKKMKCSLINAQVDPNLAQCISDTQPQECN